MVSETRETVIYCKVGIENAEILAKEFCPEFEKEDLINLDMYRTT